MKRYQTWLDGCTCRRPGEIAARRSNCSRRRHPDVHDVRLLLFDGGLGLESQAELPRDPVRVPVRLSLVDHTWKCSLRSRTMPSPVASAILYGPSPGGHPGVDVVYRGRLRERELVQKRRIGCGEVERDRRPGVVDLDAGDQVARRRSALRRALDAPVKRSGRAVRRSVRLDRREKSTAVTSPSEYSTPSRTWNVYVSPPSEGVGSEVARSGTATDPSAPGARRNATRPSFVIASSCRDAASSARAGSSCGLGSAEAIRSVPPGAVRRLLGADHQPAVGEVARPSTLEADRSPVLHVAGRDVQLDDHVVVPPRPRRCPRRRQRSGRPPTSTLVGELPARLVDLRRPCRRRFGHPARHPPATRTATVPPRH